MPIMKSAVRGLIASSALIAIASLAAVSAEDAKKLGGSELTAFGSEKPGNKEGTIPAYSGKAPNAPASFDPAAPGQRPDPYGDKPLYTITAQNAAQYADKLDGLIEVFKRYPSFKMEVFPSHRDFAYPKHILDGTLKNATACKASEQELTLDGCYAGVPFPIPTTGSQVMWDHMVQFQHVAAEGKSRGFLVPASGNPVLQTELKVVEQFDYHAPGNLAPNHAEGTAYRKFYAEASGPPRRVGEKILALAMLDMQKGDKVYQYIPGQRRVKLAPNMAYDAPSPFTGGTSTMDEGQGYYGAMDRYDWKLIGKKEKLIPYDNFSLTNAKACTEEKVISSKNFPNPECMRWELHRVWVVEATLKSGFRHVYAKRRFYWDEDFLTAGVAEGYDASGKMFRIVLQAVYPYYANEGGGGNGDSTFFLDLNTGGWAVQGFTPCPDCGWWPIKPKEARFFSPDAMSGDGIR